MFKTPIIIAKPCNQHYLCLIGYIKLINFSLEKSRNSKNKGETTN